MRSPQTPRGRDPRTVKNSNGYTKRFGWVPNQKVPCQSSKWWRASRQECFLCHSEAGKLFGFGWFVTVELDVSNFPNPSLLAKRLSWFEARSFWTQRAAKETHAMAVTDHHPALRTSASLPSQLVASVPWLGRPEGIPKSPCGFNPHLFRHFNEILLILPKTMLKPSQYCNYCTLYCICCLGTLWDLWDLPNTRTSSKICTTRAEHQPTLPCYMCSSKKSNASGRLGRENWKEGGTSHGRQQPRRVAGWQKLLLPNSKPHSQLSASCEPFSDRAPDAFSNSSRSFEEQPLHLQLYMAKKGTSMCYWSKKSKSHHRRAFCNLQSELITLCVMCISFCVYVYILSNIQKVRWYKCLPRCFSCGKDQHDQL